MPFQFSAQFAGVVIGLIAAAMVLACLQVLGNHFHRHLQRHKLRLEVHTLRNDYMDRLAALKNERGEAMADAKASSGKKVVAPTATLLREEKAAA